MRPSNLLKLPIVRGAAALIAGRAWGTRTPLIVDAELTHLCNLRCRYCDKWSPGGEPELTEAEWRSAIDELTALGAMRISFDGGEALMRKEAVSIMAYAIQKGLRANLNTNGLLFPQVADDLRGLASIKVSLDGVTAVNDFLRGRGVLSGAVKAVDAAKARGIKVGLTCVINKKNIDDIDSLLDFARKRGIHVNFQPADMLLLDSTAYESWSPPVDRYRALIDRLIEMKPTHSEVGNSLVGLKHLRKWPDPVRLPCAGGILMVNIEPGGNLYVCGRMQGLKPDINIAELGVAEAIRRLDTSGCDRCWCMGYSETNLLYSLDPWLLVEEALPRVQAAVA